MCRVLNGLKVVKRASAMQVYIPARANGCDRGAARPLFSSAGAHRTHATATCSLSSTTDTDYSLGASNLASLSGMSTSAIAAAAMASPIVGKVSAELIETPFGNVTVA